MTRILYVIIFLIFSNVSFSQTTSEKIAVFCKVWGFLKYYHPIVAKGKTDWDREFLTRINSLDSLHTRQEISDYYIAWINSLGKVRTRAGCKDVPDSLKFNLDLGWLGDTTIFTDNLIQSLQYIRENRNHGRNAYVQIFRYIGVASFGYEKLYKDSVLPSAGLRLLGLARYWNIINYFFPDKYLIGEDWTHVLREMVPEFRNAADTIAYRTAMMELTAKINDSHANGYFAKYYTQLFGGKEPLFIYKIIDNKVVVCHILNDSICKQDGIRYGDALLTLDNKPIAQIIQEKSKYIGASNEATKIRNIISSGIIFRGNTDSVKVSLDRDGKILEKTVHRYTYSKDLRSELKWPEKDKDTFSILNGNIGYVNMGLLHREQVSRMMDKYRDTKGIIFDVRNYPNGTIYEIAKALNKDRQPFAKFTFPDISYPGVFHYSPAFKCGSKNSHAYGGKVVLLCNEETLSQAEFTLMALKTAPDVTCIGSQTAGADGNVTPIWFPGAYWTAMTGLGVYYPDGRQTQRIGIVPDIEVKPTIAGIRAKKDELLDKAIEVINAK